MLGQQEPSQAVVAFSENQKAKKQINNLDLKCKLYESRCVGPIPIVFTKAEKSIMSNYEGTLLYPKSMKKTIER